MWDMETSMAQKSPWNKVKAHLGLWSRIPTQTPFLHWIPAHFYLEESRSTHWEDFLLPSKPLISYGSMLAQQLWIIVIKKKEVKELAERSADSGHVSCPERPDTISTFRGTRKESEGLESWDWSQQSRDRCCFLWQSLTFKSAIWNWNWKLIFYAAVVTYVLLLCAPCHTSLFCEWILGSFTHHFSRSRSRRSSGKPGIKRKSTHTKESHTTLGGSLQ